MTTITWLERDWWSTPPPRSPQPAAAPTARGARRRAALDQSPGGGSGRAGARFERQGAELVLVVPISVAEAAHGALVTVPAPGTTVRLRVPPGTGTGHRFQVPRFHAPAPDGFGDLTIIVEVGD